MKALSDRTVPAVLALALSGALGFAVPARAQNTAPATGTPPAAAPAQAGNAGAANAPATGTNSRPSPTEWVQRQIDRLHRQLAITPAQEQAWNQFAETMRANAQHTQQLYEDRAQHFQSMSAVDNLKNYQQIVQAEAEDLGKKVAAFQTLYDALSPDQKQAADRIFQHQEERREQRHMARHS